MLLNVAFESFRSFLQSFKKLRKEDLASLALTGGLRYCRFEKIDSFLVDGNPTTQTSPYRCPTLNI